MPHSNQQIIIAVPKGRISKELLPLLDKINITPDQDFFDPESRLLKFGTNHPNIAIIRVRSFDVATFVAYGGAHIGIAGSDVIEEYNHSDIYVPLDLAIGKCRLSIAEPVELAHKDDINQWSHVRIATKYPNITSQFFAKKGIQAECIKLSGAMELAPIVGLSRRIVDLVSTGATIQKNGLVEIEKIMNVSSKLIVNRVAYKTLHREVIAIVEQFREVLHEA